MHEPRALAASRRGPGLCPGDAVRRGRRPDAGGDLRRPAPRSHHPGQPLRDTGGWIRNDPGLDTAIVFVHGSRSDATRGFTSRDGDAKGAYWPCLVAGDPELASANLYVLQYQSDTFRERTQIEELAAGVAGALRSSRHDLPAAPQAKALDPHGAIVIIAHSLGGVVIRKALLSPQGRGTLAKTRLVYLASVPGSEVDKAFWGDRVDNQQLRELTEERLFTDIEAAWEPVARTGEGYRPRPGLRGADHL